MTVHLLLPCVGIASIEQLEEEVAEEIAQARRQRRDPVCRHHTRNFPRRAEELLDGGSIYWIIKGHICCRQPIRGLERIDDPESLKRCRILFGPEIVRTYLFPHDAMQGWRYLEAKDAPPDLALGGKRAAKGRKKGGEAEEMPPELVAELRSLGLL